MLLGDKEGIRLGFCRGVWGREFVSSFSEKLKRRLG